MNGPLHSLSESVRTGGNAMGSRRARQYYCRCGTHLAKDNTERQCARCQRASRDKLITPPEVPAEFWQTEQFQEAFAAQHIGWVFRAYRTHPHHYAVYGPDGISQTLLGQWLGRRQPQVSKIETGPPIRDLDTLAYWARVLKYRRDGCGFDCQKTRQSWLLRNQQLTISRLPPRTVRLSCRGHSHTVCNLAQARTVSTWTILNTIQCSSPPGTTEVPSKQLSC
jgi:hypothetical protein